MPGNAKVPAGLEPQFGLLRVLVGWEPQSDL